MRALKIIGLIAIYLGISAVILHYLDTGPLLAMPLVIVWLYFFACLTFNLNRALLLAVVPVLAAAASMYTVKFIIGPCDTSCHTSEVQDIIVGGDWALNIFMVSAIVFVLFGHLRDRIHHRQTHLE